jgi:hypothetical protein
MGGGQVMVCQKAQVKGDAEMTAQLLRDGFHTVEAGSVDELLRMIKSAVGVDVDGVVDAKGLEV